MLRLTRLHTFLDQFSERLEVGCEQMKRQLVSQVDQQFGLLLTKVSEMKVRFGGDHGKRDALPFVYLDDPQVETVSLDDWKQQHGESLNVPATSSGVKRKSTDNQSLTTNKRHKTGGSTAATAPRNMLVCKYAGCGKEFRFDSHLAIHERIHLNVKPFSCTWDNCSYSSEKRGTVLTHIRLIHFKLPQSIQAQHRLNIVDDRNPNDFIEVDADLVARRLE